jgi:type II secretory pathway predicted ATPase ExeA
MYETYFNLADRPFASVPRTDHYSPASVIEAARGNLARCVLRGEGAAMIIGPSGTGKSLLCELLAEQFRSTFQVALLASTHLDTRRSLLQAILYELSRPYRGMDEGELRLSLVDYISLSSECSRGLVLLVDEAHHLPLRLLDEIRALTNLTRNMLPAVRLVLAGSHILEERFASPKLESFSQRISTRCYLEAFQREETQNYIQVRMAACGGRAEIFPPETCHMVHKATDGVPRLINQVCDHALLLAYTAGIRRIEPAHVEEAWADLQQLPTPWNAPASPASTSGDGMIEFGGLDDGPMESSPIAGKIAATAAVLPAQSEFTQPGLTRPEFTQPEFTQPEFTRSEFTQPNVQVAEALDYPGVSEDPETLTLLRHIQELLADVHAEFKLTGRKRRSSATSLEPDLAWQSDLEPESLHPFAETFEEEELVTDRYAGFVLPAVSVPAASSPPILTSPMSASAFSTSTLSTPLSAAVATEGVGREAISVRQHQAEKPDLRLDEPPLRPAPTVSSSRQQFGRLFASLRRGQ